MFTGLIEEIGTMKSIGRKGEAMLLEISARVVTEGLKLGDSIAVNGVCLTATAFDAASFTVDVMPETYRNTNLKDLKPGSRVNLERAMAANGRFGGHIVQGHVDGVGKIVGTSRDQNAVVYEIAPLRSSLFKYIIPKGSVAVDGISLTVVEAGGGKFAVSIIPHTLAQTVLAIKRPGDTVNLEGDVLGKYVEHLLKYGKDHGEPKEEGSGSPSGPSGIDLPFLAANGFA
ncbi:riboflavin synthase [Paenibacillus macerans]|uniref:riboflavin synthase n=1 Tax=Paenibacillus macerans TaxID=44252 RepID=UPI00203ED975|nr:riboflavin synthase [Paenibacillus macerans]MCM3698222.1 riboflavin synthase [Paenibacillus macerans]